MFLKTHRIFKDGKHHIYYSLCESLRVSRKRVLQRRVLHLGELNTTQLERWQRTIEVVEEGGRRPPDAALYRPARAVGDDGGAARGCGRSAALQPGGGRPRQFGACWVGCKLWEELSGRVLAAGAGVEFGGGLSLYWGRETYAGHDLAGTLDDSRVYSAP